MRMLALGRWELLRGASLLASATACLLPPSAQAQSRATLDVSAGATAASNPYLFNGGDTAAVGASIDFAPSLSAKTDDTSINFEGNLSLEKYLGRYGTDESISLKGGAERQINERTTVSANIDFRSSKSASRRFFNGPDIANLGPGQFPDSSQIDPTLANLAGRTSRLEVDASLHHALSLESSLTVSAGLGLTRVTSAEGADYRDSNASVAYNRRLSETTSAVVTVAGGYADYLGQRAGDGPFVTPLVGLEHQFTSSLDFEAQVGASIAAIQSVAGGRQTTVVWAGKFDLCEREPKTTTCLTGSRSTTPTSLGGLTTVSSVGLSYSHSFGTTSSGSLSATYARSDRPSSLVLNGTSSRSELADASATYRRKIGQRISGFVTPSFTSIKDELSGRRNNYQVLLGVTYNFGMAQ